MSAAPNTVNLWTNHNSPQMVEWIDVIFMGSIEALAITKAVRTNAPVGSDLEVDKDIKKVSYVLSNHETQTMSLFSQPTIFIIGLQENAQGLCNRQEAFQQV